MGLWAHWACLWGVPSVPECRRLLLTAPETCCTYKPGLCRKEWQGEIEKLLFEVFPMLLCIFGVPTDFGSFVRPNIHEKVEVPTQLLRLVKPNCTFGI